MDLLNRFKERALYTLGLCRITPVTVFSGHPGRTALLIPSGDGKYPSFWVRDCVMMSESGLLQASELKSYLEIIASFGQNGPQARALEHGLSVPAFAVADHINYDGGAVFYPGTFSSGRDQGDGSLGFFPPLCDNYFLIDLAGRYVRQSGDHSILDQKFRGITLRERLTKAFEAYNIDVPSGLCFSDWEHPTVNWGFTDTVRMGGKLLFASLLRYRASCTMSFLARTAEERSSWDAYSAFLKSSILHAFSDDKSGWFWSSTGPHRQHDVWGTAFAVYLGITESPATLGVLASAATDGTSCNGYLRHIPWGEDYSETSAWEKCLAQGKVYQNGAWWATPTGWFLYALHLSSPKLAIQVAEAFLAHTDRYLREGAPFEWMQCNVSEFNQERNGLDFSGRFYGTSAALPYAAACRIWKASAARDRAPLP